MSSTRLAVRGGAVACLLALSGPAPASALSVPERPRLALESAERPILRDLADMRAQGESLGKVENRLDERLTQLERSLLDAAARERRERASALRQLGWALGERLAEMARNERILLLAVAGGYLWTALLWLELRRVTRGLRDLSARLRIERIHAASWSVPEDRPSGNGREEHDGLAPPA